VHLAPVSKIPGFLLDQIKRRLTFPNKAYLENEHQALAAAYSEQHHRGMQRPLSQSEENRQRASGNSQSLLEEIF
jgi:hypothetical protein